ncbi:MAG TPA: Rho termination factor N-terminal domain-containing protein, partial [Cryobacterium sp.]|nr:Rho termination factor N-terminal domain-containing protein [Cryobacterium sp.]
MTDVNLRASAADSSRLTTLRVAELQALAGELGIQGASKLRKGELVEAISEIQSRTADPTALLNADAVVPEPRKRAPRRATTATAAPAVSHVNADGGIRGGCAGVGDRSGRPACCGRGRIRKDDPEAGAAVSIDMGDGRSGGGGGGAARRTLARLLDDCVGGQEGGRIGRPGLDLGDCFHEFSFTK